jgi:hypothetical protein
LIQYDRSTTKDSETVMFLTSLLALTDNRKRLAILTLLTFAALC